MAQRTTAKPAIKRVDRFLGNLRIHRIIAQKDLIHSVLGNTREALIILDWTDPQDGIHQIPSWNWRTHGRALPLAWVTVRKDLLADRQRATEIALVKRVAGLWPRSCHPILLADRGFGAQEIFESLDALGWDGIIRVKGSTPSEIRPGVWTSPALGKKSAGIAGLIVRPVWQILWETSLPTPHGGVGAKRVSRSLVFGRLGGTFGHDVAGTMDHRGLWSAVYVRLAGTEACR